MNLKQGENFDNYLYKFQEKACESGLREEDLILFCNGLRTSGVPCGGQKGHCPSNIFCLLKPK